MRHGFGALSATNMTLLYQIIYELLVERKYNNIYLRSQQDSPLPSEKPSVMLDSHEHARPTAHLIKDDNMVTQMMESCGGVYYRLALHLSTAPKT